jgi:hypothetical protein
MQLRWMSTESILTASWIFPEAPSPTMGSDQHVLPHLAPRGTTQLPRRILFSHRAARSKANMTIRPLVPICLDDILLQTQFSIQWLAIIQHQADQAAMRNLSFPPSATLWIWVEGLPMCTKTQFNSACASLL